MLSRIIAILVYEVQSQGNYKVEFDASALTSGLFFYTINVGTFKATKKMVLLR